MKKILKKISRIIEKNWIIKVISFWILSLMPSKVLYYFQHNITRRSFKPILSIDSDWNYTLSVIEKYKSNEKIRLLEFGAGRNLGQNIFLAIKCKHLSQTVVDLNTMINPKLCFDAYREISHLLGQEILFETSNIDDLLFNLRIKYISPLDVAKYESIDKFDICVSKDTIEHIPIKNINKILENIKKLLLKDGILISCVDYSDHYSHNDINLSSLNFLRYTVPVWSIFNPPNHYQNRIRHIDFMKILQNHGFVSDNINLIKKDQLDIQPSNLYKGYKIEDLIVTRSQITSFNNI